jgi:molybdenum cofactor biosynthesis protein B
MVLPDHSGMISSALDYLIDRHDPDFIVTIGSTGISPRDVAVGAVRSLLDREIEGFGELFRRRSVERQRDLGAAAILSGTLAGVRDRTVIFSLPGSPQAVKIGTEIALDEIGHMVHMLREEH